MAPPPPSCSSTYPPIPHTHTHTQHAHRKAERAHTQGHTRAQTGTHTRAHVQAHTRAHTHAPRYRKFTPAVCTMVARVAGVYVAGLASISCSAARGTHARNRRAVAARASSLCTAASSRPHIVKQSEDRGAGLPATSSGGEHTGTHARTHTHSTHTHACARTHTHTHTQQLQPRLQSPQTHLVAAARTAPPAPGRSTPQTPRARGPPGPPRGTRAR